MIEKNLENRTKRLEWLKLTVLGVQTGWVDPYPMVISLFCVNCIYYLSYQWWGHLTLDPMSRKRTKTIYLYFLFRRTCKYLPKLRKFMLPYWEQSSEPAMQLHPPIALGPQPKGWWGPCEVRLQLFGREASSELLTRIMTLPIHYTQSRWRKDSC